MYLPLLAKKLAKKSLMAGVVSFIAVIFMMTTPMASDKEKSNKQPAFPAMPVTVAEVISEKLTEWDEFTGRLEAPQTVELRPRVSGYIDRVLFDEGSLINEGDTLFVIDDRAFNAEVKRLTANLNSAQSQLTLAKREYKRAKELISQKAISAEILDARLATQQQAQSNVMSVEAALELAKLNLSYTQVKAPITGRISRAAITKGNYVTAGSSLLTTLVSVKDVYAYFDADERTYLKYAKLVKQGRRPSSRTTESPVYMGLTSDKNFPYQGVIDFVDNHIDESTGTIRARAVFHNPEGHLIPGLFARIKVMGSASYEGILIDDKAISTNLNNKFVYVLGDDNKVQYRTVTLGEKLNGLRIIKSGLSAGERIVIKGIQKIRPGSLVKPTQVEMVKKSVLNSLRSKQERLDLFYEKEQHIVHSKNTDIQVSQLTTASVVGI